MSAVPLSDIRLPCTSEDEDDRLATFMNHDSAYFVFRRFNALNLRRLLQLQAHLLSLEREFERLKGQGHDAHASSRRDELMVEVDDCLHRYTPSFRKLIFEDRALIEQSHLKTLEEPESVAVADLRSWAEDHDSLNATQYLKVRNDLITLGTGEEAKGWAYRTVEKVLWKWFAKQRPSGANPEAGSLYVYDDRNIQRSVRALLTSISTIILLVPIIILYFIGNGYPSLIVIVVCTALFSTILAFTTEARNHEVMVAAAAYGAVLVVFLGRG
ncbi:hypothetical protein JMJ35_008303 [Cladonia borealis]|uniref:DUF6594 domain-containing protein n=1 Tax=Cladonia borealis TaxID=184061 RepID=A0AA39UYT8_9LECA|nr:hypothetical protein JMJ35_008303 [Cladonia borealis]